MIYKSLVRPRLSYGDIVYNQPNNSFLSEIIESLQYNTALAIPGTIKGSSKEKLTHELGFETLTDRQCMKKLAIYIRSYHQSNFPSSMMFYLHYKELDETNISFSHCCVEQKCSKTLFYCIQ